jgi:peptidoglycan/LPS O-acetylase OafA/YrhL
VVVFVAISAGLVVAAGAREQRLVLFYAVAVFVAFLCGLLAMAKFLRTERRRLRATVSVLGALAVAVTLASDLARGYPVVAVVCALGIAGLLYALWVRAGRPGGLTEVERLAEASLDGG